MNSMLSGQHPSQAQTPVAPFVIAPYRTITGPDDIQDDNEFKKHVLNSLLDIRDYLYNGFRIYDLDMTGVYESQPRAPGGPSRPKRVPGSTTDYKEGEYQQGGRKKTRSQKKTRRHQKTRRHR